jgi:transcriptional regulator with XRE-family HTH domain
MSNIERKRGSITLETFLRIAHGLGMQPSELAKFLDGPGSISNTTIRSDIVPVIAVGAVNRKTIEDATAEADSVRAIRSKRDAKLGGANAKIAGSKKDRNR